MSKVNDIWRSVRDRLKEPSTWAALTMPLAMFGVLSQEEAAVVGNAGADIIEATSGSSIELNLGIIGAAVSSLLGIFLSERKEG
jgi:hypothetical protein